MERFIVIHAVGSDISQDEVWQGFHAAATRAVKGAKWLRSYFLPDREELICDWEAPDEAAIRESVALADGDRLIPIKEIYYAVYAEREFFT